MGRLDSVLLAVAGLASAASAGVIYDTLWITDQQAYDVGFGNALGGRAVFGQLEDVRLADDFAVDAGEYPIGIALTRVAQDSFAALGAPPREGFIVRVYDDAGGKPGDRPTHEVSVPLTDATLSEFDDLLFGNIGVRFELDLSSQSIQLSPGAYWLNIQPVDTTAQGDWWWQLWDQGTPIGGDAHTWLDDWGFWASHGPGAVAMRVEGTAIPAPGVLAAPTFAGFALLIQRRR